MASLRSYVVFVFTIIHLRTISGDGINKSSLTFVIDDTYSMWNEINQVKSAANDIFDTVLRSKASQIENFVLVTFNDPDAKLRTITKDQGEFRRALASISVHGGDDCPEYAMKGIELAIKHSLPSSYLYVFTDAAAKDYGKFQHIKSLALKKHSQVDFILTGKCGSDSADNYQVYNKVAEVTSGKVFHMMKDDVKHILKYVQETITGREHVVVDKELPPGYDNKVGYNIDSCVGPTLISATGDKPKIGEVTGPDRSKPKTEHIVNLDKVAIAKVSCAKPGKHNVTVGSISKTRLVIAAKTNITFEIKFSAFKPSSIKDTAPKPPPTGNAFISVKLVADGVKLNAIRILNMDGKVIEEIPLELVDEKEQFYVSPSFDPPNTLFRASISGYDVNNGVAITRNSTTALEREPPVPTEEVKQVSPEVTIDGGPKVITEYNNPIQLKCKVHGYPKPDIIWVEKDTGIKLPAMVLIFELPYDYISILDIEMANKNSTYECKASNAMGQNVKYIEVETKRKIYLDIIEAPKEHVRIGYNKEGNIVCKMDAYPPVTITWFKDNKVFTGDVNIEISSDNTRLTVKNMQLNSQGRYLCEVRNEFERKVFHSDVVIFGVEKPEIYKTKEKIYAKLETDLRLSCRVTRGIPKPTLNWYFQPKDAKKFTLMKETSEVISLRNVKKNGAGLYKCIAKNEIGSDTFTTELEVQYKPEIKADVKEIKAKDGEEVILKCDIDSVPEPDVKWYFNSTELKNTAKTHISSDHSLKLQASIGDSGYYTCEAKNHLGFARKYVHVIIYVPVTIETPKKKKIEEMLGKTIVLPCQADGFPIPEIKWTFRSSDPKTPPRLVTSPDSTKDLTLQRIQLEQQGNYTCVASNNISGSANITYELSVNAPPTIDNSYLDKTFEVVEGDLVLRIQCKATGNPKPTITWQKEGLNIAIGSEWYDMDKDGTLVIKNIDSKSQGSYTCLAQNRIGSDTEMYEVIVKKTPTAERSISTLFVEEGKSLDLKCDIPHKITDLVRWYKDGVVIAEGDFSLPKVTRTNDGLYTCHVSDFYKTHSATTKVEVGFKPEFYFDVVETEIDFILDNVAELDCEAVGIPEPNVTWKHNGIDIPDLPFMILVLEMTFGEVGSYTCEVSNQFGTIQRTFSITSKDCILEMAKDFPEKQPLMLSRELTWPNFDMEDGYMIIPNAAYMYLYCPSNFLHLHSRKFATTYCEGGTQMKVRGNKYDFAELQCKEDVKPLNLRTGINCLSGNTEYINVGFSVLNEYLKAYEVCFDTDRNVTLFTKHKMSPHRFDAYRESKWFSSDLLPVDFDIMYDCNHQTRDIYSALRKGLIARNSCCFSATQLVNPQDLYPGIPPSASFHSLNVIPHWSSCNKKNWEDIEDKIRVLVTKAGRDLIIYTGGEVDDAVSPDIKLRNGVGGYQTVPQYLWKVVQDPVSSTSLAIIQVNIPDLSPEESSNHLWCRDICNIIDWMKSTNWNNVEDGFTYCCTITDFDEVFNKSFSPGMENILFDVPVMPGDTKTLI